MNMTWLIPTVAVSRCMRPTVTMFRLGMTSESESTYLLAGKTSAAPASSGSG